MVLRPGFEPGISNSKGWNAWPDYTTGAREILWGLMCLYVFPAWGGVFIWVVGVLLLGARSSVWLEHLAHNQVVVGSNPSGPTFNECSIG